MRYVLGIDQGGSKTHAVVADESGVMLGMGKSYGACHSTTGLDHALQAIVQAAEIALGQSGIRREEVTVLVGGLTGIDWDYEAELLENSICAYFPETDLDVVNDSIIAMHAGTRKRQCGILCAGSGLNCALQNGEDRFVYGYYISDEHQGGWSLGKRAVQAVIDSYVGLERETSLTGRLLEYFQVKTVDELLYMRVKNQISTEEYLHIPIILEEEALAGDNVAADIWMRYGKSIVNYLTTRAKKMGMQEEKVDIVLSGSIFKCRFQEFHRAVKEDILSSIPNANIIEAQFEPVIGAVIMGLQKIHGELSEDVYENLKVSSKKFPVRRLEGTSPGGK